MKIGLRTVKTALASVLSMALAELLGLKYATAAGVISILSLGNTKKESFYTGAGRLVSLMIATVISFICFHIFGFQPLAFGLFLLLFIPICVSLKLTDGIVVNSVLVTHFLLEKSFALELLINEFLLMVIGVGFALLFNIYMPKRKEELLENQQVIEDCFRKLIWDMGKYLNCPENVSLLEDSHYLLSTIRKGQEQARLVAKDQLFGVSDFHERYFLMRASQVRILQDMIHLQHHIQVEDIFVNDLKELLQYSADTFDEGNDGQELLVRIDQMTEFYRNQPLPSNRIEFENRARLFQFLQAFRNFVEIKSEFFLNLQSV